MHIVIIKKYFNIITIVIHCLPQCTTTILHSSVKQVKSKENFKVKALKQQKSIFKKSFFSFSFESVVFKPRPQMFPSHMQHCQRTVLLSQRMRNANKRNGTYRHNTLPTYSPGYLFCLHFPKTPESLSPESQRLF